MKVLYIEARKKNNIDMDSIDFSILPSEVFIAYSIQFKELAELIKKKLKDRVKGFQQVLGCSILRSSFPILLIGSGKFHAISLALKGNQVFILEGARINKLDEKELQAIKNKRKASLMRFYSAKTIGILASTKPGQENFKKALELKSDLEKNSKEAFIFLSGTIDLKELENFNIDSWVNTSCQALSNDSKIINIAELPSLK